MTGKSIKIIRWVEVVLVTIVIGTVYTWHIEQVPFYEDESQWIATSFYFEALFRKEQVLPEWTMFDPSFISTDSVWVENYWTVTQPPVTRYFIAIGRLIGGYKVQDLNYPWQYNLDTDQNLEIGTVPSSGLLWWSRLPMCLLATASGAILFLCLRDGVNRLSAYSLLILFLSNPFFTLHLRRAMGEAVLLFFCVLAIVFAIKGLKISRNLQKSTQKANISVWGWLVGMAAMIGLAGASKLNGLSITLSLVFIILGLGIHFPDSVSGRTRNTYIIRAITLSVLIIAITFIIVNPYLYPNPIYRTVLMIKFRGHEMAYQASLYPKSFISSTERLLIIFKKIFIENTLLIRSGWVISCFLSIIGFSHLLKSTILWFREQHKYDVQTGILLVMMTAAIPSLFSPLDWSRYFLFPVLLVNICTAIGFGAVMITLIRKIRNRCRR